MSPPLPRYLTDTDPHKLDRIIDTTPEITTTTRAGGDKQRLRGIPVIGHGGTSPGTDPHSALVAKQRFIHRRAHRA